MPDFREFDQLPNTPPIDYYTLINPNAARFINTPAAAKARHPNPPPQVRHDDEPDDLVSEWLPHNQSVPVQVRTAPEEDLVAEWLPPPKYAPEEIAKARQTIARWEAAPVDHNPYAHATIPQYLNRIIGEHQSDSWRDTAIRGAAGVGRGVGDIGDTLAQGITAGADTGAAAMARHGLISPETARAIADWRARVGAGITQNNQVFDQSAGGAGNVGRILGQIAGTAPMLSGANAALGPMVRGLGAIPSAAIRGAATGAGANVLTSSAAPDVSLKDQAVQGAEFGAGAGLAGHALGRFFGAGVDKETADLAQKARQYGIEPRAGQISQNTMVRFLDSVLQRLPFAGLSSHSAEQQLSLNRALAKEMGVAADKITPDVVNTAKRTAYNAYDTAKNSLGPLNIDRQFYQDLIDTHTNAVANLEPGPANLINGHLRNVIDKVDQASNTLDPDVYQSLTRKNGPLDKAINSKDSKISTYASDIKDALENLVGRNDPQVKALKDVADYKYFVASSVEPLANEATTGNISPAKLLKAVDYSRTNAGELGRIARRFLVEPPSSGTAERTLVMQHLSQVLSGALGLGALGGATYFDPDSWQRNALIGAGALGAGILGGRAMASRPLASAMIRSGLGQQRAPGVPIGALATPRGKKREEQ